MAISKLTALVEEAEGKKAPISRVADRWASKIVPAAVVLSIAVGLFAFFVLRVSRSHGYCARRHHPGCILSLCAGPRYANSRSRRAGQQRRFTWAAHQKSGAALEEAAKVDLFAFDKTGTLTGGRLAVERPVLLWNG